MLVVGAGLSFYDLKPVPVVLSAEVLPTNTETKGDGDCTGKETVGRCSDKCPLPTAEGTYFNRGFDPDTGKAICGFSFYHACPYSEAVSADDPLCYKDQPQPIDDPVPADFVGK